MLPGKQAAGHTAIASGGQIWLNSDQMEAIDSQKTGLEPAQDQASLSLD